MATIKYNGTELQSITECKVFEEPRKMLVWNTGFNSPIERMVCAIIPYRHEGNVIATCAAYEYCAEIPEKPAPLRVTHYELAKWLATGNGQLKAECYVYSFYPYRRRENEIDTEVPYYYKVRKWDDTEWHEPTIDYMGIKT